jgi:hypothetical protein
MRSRWQTKDENTCTLACDPRRPPHDRRPNLPEDGIGFANSGIQRENEIERVEREHKTTQFWMIL